MANELSVLTDEQRLAAYQTIVDGCKHIWSKGKLQIDRLTPVLETFSKLAEKDPYFLAHFTSYAIKNLDSKDLKVVATFMNSLSDADGTPFSAKSKYKKPNLRIVSQAAIQNLEPKLVSRVIELANMKVKIGSKSEGTHFARSLKRAVTKYLIYRENNPKSIEGIKKVGLGETYKNLYRCVHKAPSDTAASILGWTQKIGDKIVKKKFFDFKGMTELQIAEKIRKDKLSPTGVIGALPDKLSPVIAAAILEQASGDQTVILSEMFESQGLLKNKEVKALYTAKIATAKTALDRVERIKKQLDEDVSITLKKAKSDKRKADIGNIGKLFLHIDISGSMQSAIELAKNSGGIIAECVNDPINNFHWGVFNVTGRTLRTPKSFEKDAFVSALYGIVANGGTDCLALYPTARQLGCDIDVYITDQEHNGPNISSTIKRCSTKPKAAIIIQVGGGRVNLLQKELENNGIPTTVIQSNTLTESALVTQAIKTALKGATAIVEDIMNEPLLELPRWWESVR